MLMLAVLLVSCQMADFKEFTSQEGGFSVLMPGTPEEQTEQVDTLNELIDMHNFAASKGDVGYIVTYGDFPFSVTRVNTPEKLLKDLQNSVMGFGKGVQLEEKDITLGGYPGKELKVESADGKYIIYHRMYMVGERLYQVLASAPKGQESSKDIPEFLDSFKLLAQ